MKHIDLPISADIASGLRAGDSVSFSGGMFVARDAAHMRLMELHKRGEKFPVDFTGHLVYFSGPSPARAGRAVGAMGPTSSMRMCPFMRMMFERGAAGFIGKGELTKQACELYPKFKKIYFSAVGGAGALLGRAIKKYTPAAYEDLGSEAIAWIEVDGFSAYVAVDAAGGSIYL